MKKNNKRHNKNNRQFVNRRIRAPRVLCINQNNENLGVIATSEALRMATDSGLDLVQVSQNGKVPTCKILDYGKFKYDQSKREKINSKKRREAQSKLKEVKLRPSTDVNDIKVKANKIDKFLDDGCRVKISVMFRGREITHKGIAMDKMEDLMDALSSEIKIISPTKMEGRTMSAIIARSSINKKEEKVS